jgi:hypothetical protein
MSEQEYGYRCRRCGQGTAYGSPVSEDGQVKLWCFSCLKEALDRAPHEPVPAPTESREQRAESRSAAT